MGWLTALALALGGPLHGDEWAHWIQIRLFLDGDFTVQRQYLTNIPGYHALQWALLAPAGAQHFNAARLVNALFALGMAAAFWWLRRGVHPQDAARRTLLLACLPILFPFQFLVYTDVLALALLLASLGAAVRGRAWPSAVLLLASMTVRQSHVLWGGLAALLCLWPHGQARRWRALAARAVPFACVLLAFLAYWRWNGTISFSTLQAERAHPDFAFEAGNVYFALALFAVLLPGHVANGLARFAARVRAAPAWLLWPAALVLGYALWFEVDHPYNSWRQDWQWRNYVLHEIQAGAAWQVAFGALAVLGGCAVAATRFAAARQAWLLPLSLVFLAAAWMIETRYAIVPIALWLAFALPASDRTERATVGYWVALSALVGLGVFSGRFML